MDNPGCPGLIACAPLVVKGAGDEVSAALADPGCPVITNSLVSTVYGSGPHGSGGAWRAFAALAADCGSDGGGGGGVWAFFFLLARGEEPAIKEAASGQAAPTKDESGLCLEICCREDTSLFVSPLTYEQTCPTFFC